MLITPNALHRLAAVVATAFVSLVVTATAAAMPLVPEGDPPIKVRNVHGSALDSAATAGAANPGGVDWSTAAVSAAYAATIVLLVLAVALAVLRARARSRGDVAATV